MIRKLLLILFIISSNNVYASGVTVKGFSNSAGYKTTNIATAIFPCGDSITHGVGGDADGDASNDWGYRKHLQDNLGIGTYSFVGSLAFPSSDPTYYVNNFGNSGMIASSLDNAMTTEQYVSLNNLGNSSIMLLHVATNDVILQSIDHATKKTNAQIIASINSIIDKWRVWVPTGKVYVALIVPLRQADMATWWTPFNNDLNAAMVTRQATDANIVIVDMYNAFLNDRYGYCTGNWYDNCMNIFSGAHPSDNGYKTMADQWAACINNNSAVGCNGH